MALRDWSKAKFTFLILFPIAAVVIVAINVLKPLPTPLSEDCQRVDQVLRHWVHVLPDMQLGMTPDGDTSQLAGDTAAGAAAIRDEATAITDTALKSDSMRLADKMDQLSHGNPSSPPNGFPDRDYVGGLQGSMAAANDLIAACPGVGDELPEDWAEPSRDRDQPRN